MKKKFIVTAILMGLFFATCDNTYHPTIPYKKVDFTIYPNDVMFYRLNTYGGYEYFTGGIGGIVVFRLDEWTFKAYDRSCSYDWDEAGSWIWMHPNGITLIDSLCGSIYNVLDGTVITGPAKWPLREYYTRYDGMKLRVYS